MITALAIRDWRLLIRSALSMRASYGEAMAPSCG
jgi:hypothetical protein